MPNRFVNPYTFIPLRSRSKSPLTAEGESLTGVISCTLKVMTPVIIPEGTVKTVGDVGPAYVNPCFRIGGEPAIPGSSIRGPIRSLYEALTNSCMRVNDVQLSSAGGSKLPGLLRREGTEVNPEYVLYTAKRYRDVDYILGSDTATGTEVHVKVGLEVEANQYRFSSGIVRSVGEAGDSEALKGYYLRVNDMKKRVQDENGHWEDVTVNRPSVFVEDERIAQPVDKRYVKAFCENVRRYVENSKDSGLLSFESPYPGLYEVCLDRMLSGDATLPVWYSYERLQDNTYAFHLAWAQLSRSVYPRSTTDFVTNPKLKLGPCPGENGSLCPACDLFGFVDLSDGNPGGAKASGLRFTDAVPSEHVETDTFILPPLLGPRVQAIEFYLRNKGHSNSFTPMTPGTQLAGRKAYWSSRSGIRNLSEDEIRTAPGKEDKNETRFAARVEAIPKGATLRFDVFFDGASRLQLNELVYVLSLGREWDGDCGDRWHKIGHGKPVGAGSVRIEVEDVLVRPEPIGGDDDHMTYRLFPWDDKGYRCRMDSLGSEGEDAAVLRRMSGVEEVMWAVTPLNLDEDEVVMDYPRSAEGGDIYDWFKSNHDPGVGNEGQTIAGYREVLPRVGLDKQDLPMKVGRDQLKFLVGSHPQTVEKRRGTIKDARMNADGSWCGYISNDEGRGTIRFLSWENAHITDVEAYPIGTKVEYEVMQVRRSGRRNHIERHAVRVRKA